MGRSCGYMRLVHIYDPACFAPAHRNQIPARLGKTRQDKTSATVTDNEQQETFVAS